jgi:aminomuconate-semialdehyde/2-hydroxymuconate-6-semialdehyde dehydrogenase
LTVEEIRNFIGGALVPAESGETIENVEPATGRAYGTLPRSSARDVDAAVAAAQQAFDAWSHTPAEERSRILLRIASGIEDRAEDFARAESVDNGKPVALARRVDIPRAVKNFRFFATAILHWHSESHATDDVALNYTLRRPRGVAGLISPWNLPIYLLSWKVAPALATGNTAVAKPSEVTPMTAFLLAEVCMEAGLSAGVLNIVHGYGPEAGAAIVAHPRVGAVSFTGSTRAGAEIARVAAPAFKKLALEMGGKNPNVVFADADLESALRESVRSSFANQGQICLCGSRILVQRSVYDDFVGELVARTEELRVGDPLDDRIDQGAVVSAAHLDKIESYVGLARDEGGTILTGGTRPSGLPERCREGFFYRPTVITDLGPHCRVNQEEIFGPVVTVLPFDDEEQAVEWANATQYGLSATLWTNDLKRAHRVAAKLDAGTVWVNCWLLRDLRVPFGGVKASGVEREGGEEALRFFTEPKNVCVKL